jgi:mono/diheme cytochrome c family protein
MARKGSSGGGFGRFGGFFLGFFTALLLLTAGIAVYFKFGRPPVAVADAPFPFERAIVQLPLNARIGRETRPAPFGTSEDVFEAGAHVYRNECASCHGTPGHDVAFARHMYPSAPQLWKKHTRGNVVGVSDDEAGETYWKVANGIRLSGMPSYAHVLSQAQMWDVSLLLKNADQQLPDPVMGILTGK